MTIRAPFLFLLIIALLFTTTAIADDSVTVQTASLHQQLAELYPELKANHLPTIKRVDAYSLENSSDIAMIVFLQYDEELRQFSLHTSNQHGIIESLSCYIVEVDVLEQHIADTAVEKDPVRLKEHALDTVKSHLSKVFPNDDVSSIAFLDVELDADKYSAYRENYNALGIENIYTEDTYSAVLMYFYAPSDTAMFTKNQLIRVTWDSVYDAITQWAIYPIGFELTVE